ncbi:amidohydrolase family protein [Cryptosporangium sp. NPDC051539]|uniref:metal-dependent hydrolase family protein n=1 Tax=Cryptosporangium sp. NPDC051539 TaxID=3363962 RepID=UPI0037ADB86B
MSYVITGVDVVDGTSGGLTAEQDVLVDGARIAAVGRDLSASRSVDGRGLTLLPGLFDCHVHVVNSGVDPAEALSKPFSTQFYDAIDNLNRTVAAGITTIRDAGGADLGIRTAVDAGRINGPRMRIAVQMLSQTGGHNDHWTVSGGCSVSIGAQPHPGRPGPLVDGVDEMRRKVRELKRAGADVIKICASGGVVSPRDEPQHPQFRPDELAECVAEAAATGTAVMAHAHSAAGIASAVEAGVRSVEHGVFLDEPTAELMAERGTWLVPTLSAPLSVVEAYDRGVPFPPAVVRKAREVAAQHERSFRLAHSMGIRIAMGSDSGVGPHGSNLRELELMERYGMKPSEVLVSATSSSAELLGVSRDLGTVEDGKLADFVLVEGTPYRFADLHRRIRAVFKEGRQVHGAPLPARP